MRPRIPLLLALVALPMAPAAAQHQQHDPAAPGRDPAAAPHLHGRDQATPGEHSMRHEGGIEHSFTDAEGWATRFESADRDEWQRPDQVVAALGLEPGMTIADIGSGTGYFTRRFAAAVGAGGAVYAADVEPEMAVYVRRRADEDGQANVIPVLASYDDPRLPDGTVDLVFICNTWHHIQDRVEYARRLTRDLAPGGRVAIVDFVDGELPIGPRAEHKLSAEEVAAELDAAGFELAARHDALPYQYLLVFAPR